MRLATDEGLVVAKILVIDDDDALLTTICDWLNYEEHQTEPVGTGAEGWRRMQSQEHELIILDWDLPDINGIDLLKRFRKSGGTVPIIMLTGRMSIDDKTAGLDSGADDYLVKPFHVKELSSRIKAVLRKSERTTLKPLGVENREVLDRGDLVGTSLAARYEFIDVIGSGAVGIVFKARHPHLQRLYAIKMIHSQEHTADNASRFEQEAQLISTLEHPNIATIHDFGITERGRPFMVLDYIDGLNLGAVLAERQQLPTAEALSIVGQIAEGMDYAHKAGIIHRDLKPTNIMLKNNDGKTLVKIVDFGCAKLRTASNDKRALETITGLVVGTPVYMSPEQACGEKIDQRSDIYSLGCLLYEALTGRMPHAGLETVEVMAKHVHVEPASLKEIRKDLEFVPGLQQLLNKALAKNPQARYQTMAEFKTALDAVKQRVQATSGTRFSFWQMLREGIASAGKRDSSGKMTSGKNAPAKRQKDSDGAASEQT
jgi:serine/threonine protein kinase/ActR/RegA family two-component response regulator